jgi:hypothetical protein
MRMPELRKECGLPTSRPAVSGRATPHMADSLNVPMRIRPITVVLADDAEFARNAVKRMLRSEPERALVREAHNSPQNPCNVFGTETQRCLAGPSHARRSFGALARKIEAVGWFKICYRNVRME